MMPILRAWSLRLRRMFRKERLDRELEAEFASHLELHIKSPETFPADGHLILRQKRRYNDENEQEGIQ